MENEFVNPDFLVRVPVAIDTFPSAAEFFSAAEPLLPDFFIADVTEPLPITPCNQNLNVCIIDSVHFAGFIVALNPSGLGFPA